MADANQIDSYLKGKGSPMAGQGRTFVAAGRKYGVDPALLIGISGAESSFGKHLFGPHNAWGWGPGIKFGSWEEGISTVARGLRKGYLDQGLTSPGKIVSKYAPGSDGNDEHGWTSSVETFMRELGVNPASVTRRTASREPSFDVPKLAPLAPPPSFDAIIRGNAGRDPGSQVRSLVEGMIAAESRGAQKIPSPVPSSRAVPSSFDAAPPPSSKRGMNADYWQWVGTPDKRTGPSKPHTAEILNFVGHVGEVAQTKLTPWGNESHSLLTVDGTPSAHALGRAADIPASGAELIRLGHDALIAAGMSPAEARRQKGGLFNVGHYQVIFNTHIGGNHTDHVHVGLRG